MNYKKMEWINLTVYVQRTSNGHQAMEGRKEGTEMRKKRKTTPSPRLTPQTSSAGSSPMGRLGPIPKLNQCTEVANAVVGSTSAKHK